VEWHYNAAVFTDGGALAETETLTDLIDRLFEIPPQTILPDYGCGIGRMAKELIKRPGCRIVGVDIRLGSKLIKSAQHNRGSRGTVGGTGREGCG
jgi:cyclopropane fatty-acyl-phospholipid synthase-like methyltransferase